MRSACPTHSHVTCTFQPSHAPLFGCTRTREESRPVHSTSPPALLRHRFIFNRATHHGTDSANFAALLLVHISVSSSFSFFLFLSRHVGVRMYVCVLLRRALLPLRAFLFLFLLSCRSVFFSSLPLLLIRGYTLVFIAPTDGATRHLGAPYVSRICAPSALVHSQERADLRSPPSAFPPTLRSRRKETTGIIERLIIAPSPTISNRLLVMRESLYYLDAIEDCRVIRWRRPQRIQYCCQAFHARYFLLVLLFNYVR